MEIIDEICLIYLNVFEESDGIKLEFNYNNIFDSLEILKNNKPFKKLYKNQNSLLDNNGILENNEYYVVDFYEDDKLVESRIMETDGVYHSESYAESAAENWCLGYM